MSSTHSASPLSCVAGLENLNTILEDELVAKSERDGRHLHDRLQRIADSSPVISSVQGKGLVAALITESWNGWDAARVATEIAEACMKRGLLVVHTGRESVKLAPPLTIDRQALDEGLDVLNEVVSDIAEAAA